MSIPRRIVAQTRDVRIQNQLANDLRYQRSTFGVVWWSVIVLKLTSTTACAERLRTSTPSSVSHDSITARRRRIYGYEHELFRQRSGGNKGRESLGMWEIRWRHEARREEVQVATRRTCLRKTGSQSFRLPIE